MAKPRDPAVFQAMQEEAASTGDMAVLPGVWEGYHNITHQTLEVFRLAAIMPSVTHVAKASTACAAGAVLGLDLHRPLTSAQGSTPQA